MPQIVIHARNSGFWQIRHAVGLMRAEAVKRGLDFDPVLTMNPIRVATLMGRNYDPVKSTHVAGCRLVVDATITEKPSRTVPQLNDRSYVLPADVAILSSPGLTFQIQW